MTVRAEPRLDRAGERPIRTGVRESPIVRAPPVRPAAAPGHAAERAQARPRRRARPSPLTRRILTLNVLALAIPVVGLLYLDEYRANLVESELASLHTIGELFAGALGAGGVVSDPLGEERLSLEITRHMVRRLADASKSRARLFDRDGTLLADSFRLAGPGGQIEIEVLPPARAKGLMGDLLANLYDRVVGLLPQDRSLPPYREAAGQRVADYPEVGRALVGEGASAVRSDGAGGMVLSVAVPVQRYRQVLGALLLSTDGRRIDEAVRAVRFDILQVFGVALAVTVLLSLYLAGTIARPIHRLAEAAERVRHGQGRQTSIPDFGRRRDEIGDLAGALREMTEALWQRMDAIERFAADVAHEIKNPLTSLRSAVETVARIEDPAQQRRLMGIILDDVQRLDRLISDISEASRLDAELSRAEAAPVDLASMLGALAGVHEATAGDRRGPRLELDVAPHQQL
ncbi:MAG TPA: stimulus-sensing domain-containing protein, partial [Dongiaceae bacterium]|nr:stimulus-sensing domain-containing protein [Dongiaceae bacterium]